MIKIKQLDIKINSYLRKIEKDKNKEMNFKCVIFLTGKYHLVSKNNYCRLSIVLVSSLFLSASINSACFGPRAFETTTRSASDNAKHE